MKEERERELILVQKKSERIEKTKGNRIQVSEGIYKERTFFWVYSFAESEKKIEVERKLDLFFSFLLVVVAVWFSKDLDRRQKTQKGNIQIQ